jgi:hypothetical protein
VNGRVECRVARIPCNVDGVGGRPYRFGVAAIVVIMSVMWRRASLLSRTRPRVLAQIALKNY